MIILFNGEQEKYTNNYSEIYAICVTEFGAKFIKNGLSKYDLTHFSNLRNWTQKETCFNINCLE